MIKNYNCNYKNINNIIYKYNLIGIIVLCILIFIIIIIILLLHLILINKTITNKKNILLNKTITVNKNILLDDNIINKNYTWVYNNEYKIFKNFYNKNLCKYKKYIKWKYIPNYNIDINNKLIEDLCQISIDAWQEVTYEYIYFIKSNDGDDMTFSIQHKMNNMYIKKKYNYTINESNQMGVLAHSHGSKYMDIHINYHRLKDASISQIVMMILHEIGHSIGAYDKYDSKYNNSLMYAASTNRILNLFDLTNEIDIITIHMIERHNRCSLIYSLIKSYSKINLKKWELDKYNNWYPIINNNIHWNNKSNLWELKTHNNIVITWNNVTNLWNINI
ncbi:hypothetical protein AHEV_029 [Adoxophyes honmai entomopoxvirus 'L']|uniref:Uncharacterized protein n=1 Tax=Adoxophyes honmai entomopoxvirus 'L' TaxID=1293540 RepID=A0A916P625_9POXV|nr:hypothetical protein AHEV_029 [Adoxophyes honmai entomopoxvirus 'L']CCU55350.1 hypothetical protein AHEV_029 [Adoxophyes honmai entomopoxvirus 'L']